MSLLMNEDMPDSNCSSGSTTLPAFESARSVAKAARAHSTVARHPLEAVEPVGDLAILAVIGDVDTRFKERGWSGVMGTEFDRLRVPRDLETLPLVGGCVVALADGFFAASPRDLRVALMTCVARRAFSFDESPPSRAPSCCTACAAAACARFVLVVFVFVVVLVSFAFAVVVGFAPSICASLPCSSSFSVADMAGVQVCIAATALRMASACVVIIEAM